MNRSVPPSSDKTIRPSPFFRQGLQMIVLIALLVLTASVFESLRFFRPVILQADGPHQPQPLPDGTGVTLHPGSRLSLGNEWHYGGLREVWLRGGAWFVVPRQADTTSLTIHLRAFDVAVRHATLYCSNRKEESYAWLKEGSASILTHESKQKKLGFKPGTVIKYSGHRLQVEPAADTTHLISSPAN